LVVGGVTYKTPLLFGRLLLVDVEEEANSWEEFLLGRRSVGICALAFSYVRT